MKGNMCFAKGLKDGIPVALGYLSVGFGFGILAASAGLSPLIAFLISATNLTSAGQVAGVGVIAAAGTDIEMALTQLVINIRYMLMSAALSQKINTNTPLWKRMLLAYFVTDEIFGISASVKGELNPYYNFGAISVGSPLWALGTVLGVLVGNILPASLTSALAVALYAMFLAVVIPAAKSDRTVAAVVAVSMAGSLAFTFLPLLSEIDGGTRIIILTVVIAAAAAVIRPVPAEKEGQ